MAAAVSDDPDVKAVQRISAVPIALRVIGQITGLRLALVARVTEDMWKACAVLDRMNFGLEPGGLLDVATTLCSKVRDTKKPVIIDCASRDLEYKNHPTPKMYGFESYVSVPIYTRAGQYFGNVCALDTRPMELKNSETLPMMELYAQLIGLQLEAEERHQETHAALLDARETAQLREQFIAVLGHDIRTPLAAIASGANLLARRDSIDPSSQKVLQRIVRSAARIARLVDDILDFARGRLGGGIGLTRLEAPRAEVQGRLFQPFERGGETGRGGGLGLGLYIVSQVVKSHAGTVQVHSDPAGTTFTCVIPRRRE